MAALTRLRAGNLKEPRRTQRVSALLLLMTTLMGCGPSSFLGGGSADHKKNDQPSTVAEAPPAVSSTKEGSGSDVAVATTKSLSLVLIPERVVPVPIDLVMTVDNTASMVQEAENVSKNLLAFMATVSQRADVRLTLLNNSGASRETKVLLPKELMDKGAFQVNIGIGDRSMLAQVAAATCPVATTAEAATPHNTSLLVPVPGTTVKVSGCTYKICGKDVFVPNCALMLDDNVTPTVATTFRKTVDEFPIDYAVPTVFLQAGSGLRGIRGEVNTRLRKGARLVYVMVSDDDSTVVDELNFIELVKPQVPSRSIEVYGFAAIPGITVAKSVDGKPTCTLVGNPGPATYSRSYIQLAKKNGGMTYDICAENWKPYFDNMALKITETLQAETTYDLGIKGVASIASATMSGKAIPLERLQLVSGSSVVLPNDLVTVGATLDLELIMTLP